MKKIILASLMAILFVGAYAQEEEPKIKYSNITEFGFMMASPKGIGFEATTVNGFTINKKHCLGLGIGIGAQTYREYYEGTAYTPIFANYRLYFQPDKTFSPHINVAFGGLMVSDGEGFYSSVSAGFRAGKFSFSSGVSFMPVFRPSEVYYYDQWESCYSGEGPKEWYYPFGIMLKWGFSF